MEFSEVVARRRMVRRYTDEAVDPAALDRALAHAVRAPSAGFSQGWGFVVLDTAADVRRFWEATSDDAGPGGTPDPWLAGMMGAPVVVLPCSSEAAYRARYAEPDKSGPGHTQPRWSMPYWHLDTAMASLLVLLTAVDEGLGGCFFGIPADRGPAVRRVFGIPADHDPIGAITLGHPDPTATAGGSPRSRSRRPLTEVVHRGGWAR